MKKVLQHEWSIHLNSLDRQCSKCGAVKHWDDQLDRFIFMDRLGIHYFRPPCILLNATSVTFTKP